jgi:hypothetical protein
MAAAQMKRMHPTSVSARRLGIALLCVAAMAACGCQGAGPTLSAARTRDAVQPPAAAQASGGDNATAVHAVTAYPNVPLLGARDVAEFDRTMKAINEWVAPQQGCTHCHVDGDAASDARPAKQAARRVLQMVQHVNNDWKRHVGGTGITCHTCHRGVPVPAPGSGPAGSGSDPLQVAVQPANPATATATPPAATRALAQDGWMQPEPKSQAAVAAAASGLRLLQDINSERLGLPSPAGGRPATAANCDSCHQGARKPAAEGAAGTRECAALSLVPVEHETAEPGRQALERPDTGQRAAAALSAVAAGTRIPAATAQRPLVGGAPLPLFSARDNACAMLDLHPQPGDTVEAFVRHAGHTIRRCATVGPARAARPAAGYGRIAWAWAGARPA